MVVTVLVAMALVVMARVVIGDDCNGGEVVWEGGMATSCKKLQLLTCTKCL